MIKMRKLRQFRALEKHEPLFTNVRLALAAADKSVTHIVKRFTGRDTESWVIVSRRRGEFTQPFQSISVYVLCDKMGEDALAI